MEVNKVSFGSTFYFTPNQVKRIGQNSQRKLISLFRQYTGVNPYTVNRVLTGNSSTITVKDADDKFIMGFFKTVRVKPKKLENI